MQSFTTQFGYTITVGQTGLLRSKFSTNDRVREITVTRISASGRFFYVSEVQTKGNSSRTIEHKITSSNRTVTGSHMGNSYVILNVIK
jgi:hypothetical protein